MASVLALALPAQAHEPVILDAGDVLPWNGPLILDGTQAAALFGTLPNAAAVRSAQLRMQAGDQLNIALAVTNLAPESGLASWQLPRVLVVAPNGSSTVLNPTVRVPFTVGGMQLLRLREYSTTAIVGTYSLVVSGAAPARFLVSTGVEGVDLEDLERATIATPAQVAAWYNTAP
ncbi:hypothetical protein [Micromonospora sp. CPCC 206061]|uniref:hypothetical protein n=1 Tax=Micromonospora sp. CPCC 206061 TaxID=3122410 RepID=UPI002FF37948